MIRMFSKVASRHQLWQSPCFSLLQLRDGSMRQSVHSAVKLPFPGLPYRPQMVRSFSFEQNDTEFLCSNKARIRLNNLEVITKDFKWRSGAATSPKLDQFIEDAEKTAARDYNIGRLKDLYAKLVRPELVSRLLIHKHDFSHRFTQWLKYQSHALRKKDPKFTTSYDVMERVEGLPRSDWVHFFNYLAQERIPVVEEWVKISTVEIMMYHHGIKDFNDIHFFKGEADASFHHSSNTADVATLIWDNEQVISAETHLGVTGCLSPLHSEGKAMFALLTKGKEIGIDNFHVWTDNRKIAEVLSGKRYVRNDDQNWRLFMALRSMRSAYKRLIVSCVARELLQFTDGVLRQPDTMAIKAEKDNLPRFVKQPASEWAYQLNGLPLFDLSMAPEAVRVMNDFDKPKDGEPHSMKYYVEVAEQSKLSALQNIIQVLNPVKLYVAVKQMENKPAFLLEQLHGLIGNSITAKSNDWSILSSEARRPNPNGKKLMVVFDGFYQGDGLLHNADFTISLSKHEEIDALMARGFLELSASTYIYYHGACLPTKNKKVV